MLKYKKLLTTSGTVIGFGLYSYQYYINPYQSEQKYTYNDVAKHNNINNMWVTYKNKVYDVTNFIENHPGGKDKIMLAAGKSLEPYWNTYQQHLQPEVIKEILEPMKIGTLTDPSTWSCGIHFLGLLDKVLRFRH